MGTLRRSFSTIKQLHKPISNVLFMCVRNVVQGHGERSVHFNNEFLKRFAPPRPGQLTHSWSPLVNAPFIQGKAEKKLFTPGPLGVSKTTKEAAQRDLGSRDKDFMETIKFIRHRLLDLAGVSSNQFTSVLLQGSGTYGVEAVLRTVISSGNGKLLVIANGAYGKRMKVICQCAGLNHDVLDFSEAERISPARLEAYLQRNTEYNAVAIVHCETTTGLVNDITFVGQLVKMYCPQAVFIVDAMSSFGAIPIDFEKAGIKYLVTSANKCLEGIPGFSVVIADIKCLLSCKGICQSLSLDIVDQYETMEKTGQFRFTPPTHALLAFAQALQELDSEGGVEGRARRYRTNCEILKEGMKKFGFQEVIPDNYDGYIITTYHIPKTSKFIFNEFYRRLNDLDDAIISQGMNFHSDFLNKMFGLKSVQHGTSRFSDEDIINTCRVILDPNSTSDVSEDNESSDEQVIKKPSTQFKMVPYILNS